MPSILLKQDLTNGDIYLEAKGTLASRIDFAWEAYQNNTNTKNERKKALQFLIYAFDISDTANVNAQLIQLMAEREQHKVTNPEFIPGKSPSRIPFDPKTVIPKRTNLHGQADSLELREAIQKRELLDVTDDSKQLDRDRGTTFLTAEQRAERRVNISGGLFKKDGKPFDTSSMHSHDKQGFAAYTINANGEISIFTHNRMQDGFAHSSMNAGSPVVAAGEIKIEKGILKVITTHSGHYKPSLFNVARALEHFTLNNIDISQAKVVTFDDPSASLKSVKSDSVYYDAYKTDMYETPASQIYSQMDRLIDENINSINKQVKAYNKGGFLTSVFHLKDKLTGSTLTQQRADLAAEFESKITLFKKGFKNVSTTDIPDKITELESLITTYQERNAKLSTDAKKNESSGRLASTTANFKEKLAAIKDHATESVEPEHSASMKNIS